MHIVFYWNAINLGLKHTEFLSEIIIKMILNWRKFVLLFSHRGTYVYAIMNFNIYFQVLYKNPISKKF